MKIVKFIMALSFVCCAMAAPVTASESNDYAQLATEVSKLSDNGMSPIVRKLAINFLEKNVKNLVSGKEKQIKRLYASISELQDDIQYLYSEDGGYSDWDEKEKKEMETRWKAKIEAKYAQIPECQETLEMYKELLSEVQALKAAN
jgi:TolA-binding protein